MTTDPSTLPQWKGHPVPWVTRWTGEVSHDKAKLSLTREGLLVHYEDGRENRDQGGILWMREGLTRAGAPEFSQVNAYRQRLSMSRRRCQVCGRKIESKVIHWLMVPEQLQTTPDGRTVTVSPPTCDDCIPLALELCPALKRGHIVVKVLEYVPWGVQGMVVGHKDGRATQHNARVEYARDDYPFPKTCVVARQSVVEFTKFVVEKMPGATTPREETLSK